jgi:hypothetical protein
MVPPPTTCTLEKSTHSLLLVSLRQSTSGEGRHQQIRQGVSSKIHHTRTPLAAGHMCDAAPNQVQSYVWEWGRRQGAEGSGAPQQLQPRV